MNEWEKGIPFHYPSYIKERFQWTNFNGKETFTINPNLPKSQDESAFMEYIKKSKSKYVVAFPNLSGDTILVIPMPNGKNYATLKDFVDNAPKKQQIFFWKKVAKNAKEMGWKCISVHGLGVPYTHVRISMNPKIFY